MARRKKLVKVVLGVLVGVLISQFSNREHTCSQSRPKAAAAAPPPARSDDNLVFVGVMTAAQYLDTRARAVYETWGRKLPGKVVFFSSEDSYSDQVPLVALPDVDDSYPPQKKSFMMLKYMYDHYIDRFEWFMRADDDVYVRTDRLEELLRSVDSRKPWFIGQTGRGTTEEFGTLSLDSDENFCMGGPGVIFSRETLKRMAPFVEECLSNLYTTHEDVELGRCVRRFAGISCTWSYEASDCDCKARKVEFLLGVGWRGEVSVLHAKYDGAAKNSNGNGGHVAFEQEIDLTKTGLFLGFYF